MLFTASRHHQPGLNLWQRFEKESYLTHHHFLIFNIGVVFGSSVSLLLIRLAEKVGADMELA